MTLNDLIKTARARVDDNAEGQLWSRAEWMEYANDAQNEACRRGRLLLDSTTPTVCKLDLTEDGVVYDLHDSILFIRRARLVGADGAGLGTLRRAHVLDLDRQRGPGWQEEKAQPTHYVPDMDTGMFRPFPTPDQEYLVQLTVVRLPLKPEANEVYAMEDGDDVPEIKSRWHLGLVNWMMHRAYSKHDSEAYNPKAAERYEADFTREFGPRSSAMDENWLAREADYTEAEGNY